MKKIALIIGRFQPFHLGHLMLIKKASNSKDIIKIKIGIGSSQFKNTEENPFSAFERGEMIEKSLRGNISIPYEIFEIPDIGNDKKWVSHVEKIVGKFDVVYTNGKLEKRLFKDRNYEVRTTPLFNRKNYSGTEIRKRIISGRKWKNLVPKGTLEVIEKINGEERIKSLHSSK
ncbi:MAG: nicotinamide-nucleotide adenylyltransferase [Candidatus Altiarchaeota archaeon]